MNFFLQNSALLWLAPIIAIPVLLHFLARAKPPRYLFSNTLMIKKVVQQTLRLKRPKDRLLLICRTLLAIVLLLVFLRPMLYLKNFELDNNQPKHLIIIVDRSASMAWSEGGQSRFKAACDEVDDILDRLSSADFANIIWLDSEPNTVFPEMGSNITYLRDSLREAGVTNEAGNPVGAIQLAISQLHEAKGARELCIISDFQSSQWKDVKISIPEDIKVSTIWPVKDDAENGAVLSIRTDPVSPLAGEPTQIICSIGNYSAAPKNRTVILEIGEKRITREVQIPTWGRGVVAIEHIFLKNGQVPISVRLDEDAFGIDDWRGKIVSVRNSIKVGLMGGDPSITPVWKRALQAFPWVELIELNKESLDHIDQYDLVMFSGWNGENREKLAVLRKNKVPIILSPAQGLEQKNISYITGQGETNAASTVVHEKVEPAIGLKIDDNGHKVFSIFRNGEFGDPAQASFHKRLRLPEKTVGGQAILSYLDGEPALVQYGTESPIFIWLAPLSPESSNWATTVAFLPFFGELISVVQSRTERLPQEAGETGENLTFEFDTFFEEVQLLDKKNQPVPITRTDSPGKIRFVSEPIVHPGIYRLCTDKNCHRLKAVNFPTGESDLRVQSPPLITKRMSQAVKSSKEFHAAKEGTPLWKILVWVALVLICVESLLVLLLHFEDKKVSEGRL